MKDKQKKFSEPVSKYPNVCQPQMEHKGERGDSPGRSPLITLTNRYAPQTCYNFVIPRYIIIAILVARTLLIYRLYVNMTVLLLLSCIEGLTQGMNFCKCSIVRSTVQINNIFNQRCCTTE